MFLFLFMNMTYQRVLISYVYEYKTNHIFSHLSQNQHCMTRTNSSSSPSCSVVSTGSSPAARSSGSAGTTPKGYHNNDLSSYNARDIF